jgi:hypothetical protein
VACRAIYKDKALLGISPTGNAAFRSASDGRGRAVQQRFRPTFPVAHPNPFPTGNDARSSITPRAVLATRCRQFPARDRLADGALEIPAVITRLDLGGDGLVSVRSTKGKILTIGSCLAHGTCK